MSELPNVVTNVELPNVATNIESPVCPRNSNKKDIDDNKKDDDDDYDYTQSQRLLGDLDSQTQVPQVVTTTVTPDSPMDDGSNLLNTQTQEEINNWMNSALN